MTPIRSPPAACALPDSTWCFAAMVEDCSAETEQGAIFPTTFYHLRVICHERTLIKDRNAVTCKEYKWMVRRRFSEFQTLEEDLRLAELLSDSCHVRAPKKTLLKHLVPSAAFEQKRASQLIHFLTEAMEAVGNTALPASKQNKAFELQLLAPDALGKGILAAFLGLESAEDPKAGKRLGWLLPEDAEERTAALVHSLDRGIYVWDHDYPGPPTNTLRRLNKQITFGDLTVTCTEGRSAGVTCPLQKLRRSASRSDKADGTASPWRRSISESAGTPKLASPLTRFASEPCSLASSPSVSRFTSPEASPVQSRTASPPRSLGLGDECWSFTSTSTTDSWKPDDEPCEVYNHRQVAVWLEVDLDSESTRLQEHNRWWARMEQRVAAAKAKATRGASCIDKSLAGLGEKQDKDADRQRVMALYETEVAKWRELSARHPEAFHPILAYGGQGNQWVMVQQAAAGCCGLRSLPFTPHRCHHLFGQMLKALVHLHKQAGAHGHLSPESILIDEAPMGPQARLMWAPGQRRPEGHMPATVGFRGPGKAPAGPEGDIYSLACVILVWWAGFASPHPWTQFARSTRLQQDIQAALSEEPPMLPKALLDLHGAAAVAEEPEHTFLCLLASLLTRCLVWTTAGRVGAADLLQDRFFLQAL